MEPLKVLVVDDDPEKLRRVLSCLQSIPGCPSEACHSAHDANEAKRLLKENCYDLMILDINLPQRAEELPTFDGGIKLLEEVLERESYFKPREVVGLTAYTEVLESAGRRFAEDLWLVIHYDAASDSWFQQLQRKVRHILLTKRAGTIPEYKTYLCIVNALADPELSALLDLPWKWQQFEVPNDPSVYHRGSVVKDEEPHEVIAAAASRMGMTAAAVLSMKMITQFRPRYLAMTGILAGVRGRCNLGDIVVADPNWDWGSGKYQAADGAHRFLPAPYQTNLNSFLRSKLSLVCADGTALDKIRRGWKGTETDNVLRMHIGPVASGASVVGDSEMTKLIIQQHRKLIGIEMESYGVLAAAEESPLPQPKAFSIKSVSDFADDDKSDAYQKYAAYTSSAGLQVFVERFL